MPSQLITSTPIHWTCPTCGFQLTVPKPGAAINCRCGARHFSDETAAERHQDKPLTKAELNARLDICRTCDEWNNNRCVQINLGCRQSFHDTVRSSCGLCPLGKWEQSHVHQVHFFPSVERLNLIYHVYPSKKNDVWRANVRQVERRLRIFNGRKVVAVSVSADVHGVDVVRKEFRDDSIEYLEIPNDPQLREVATFLPLLEAIKSDDPWEATFYAHTKGNSTRDNALGAELWRNQAYHSLLDGVNVCRDLLLTHPCVGTHKMVWPADGPPPYPSGLIHGNWMLAGTFFWFRHSDVFTNPRWRDVPRDRYGAEAWLAGMFGPEQAASVFQPWPVSEYPTPSPYDPALYLWPIRDT